MKQAIIDRLGISRVVRSVDETVELLEQTRERLLEVERASSILSAGLADVDERLRLWQRISWDTTLAAAQPTPQHSAKISVVMATRNRASLVREAIGSVVAQTATHWELVIVDDGSDDDTPAVLAAIDDPRVRSLRTPGVGAGAARNVGISAATGDYVAFLDDDNKMSSGWIHAVQLHVATHASCSALYGAQLRQAERDARIDGPSLLFVPSIELDSLIDNNCVDLAAIVVSRDHPELAFDEQLRRGIDWEMIVRIFRTSGMEPLAVWASWYLTGADRRITTHVEQAALDDLARRMRDPQDPQGTPGRFQPAGPLGSQ
jgi:hypothetical protein